VVPSSNTGRDRIDPPNAAFGEAQTAHSFFNPCPLVVRNSVWSGELMAAMMTSCRPDHNPEVNSNSRPRRRRLKDKCVVDAFPPRPKVGPMEHSPGFLKVVHEARSRVKEISIQEARQKLAQNPDAILLDVREDREWEAGRAADAVHLGRGVLERDIEKRFPDQSAELLMYCGGGYRSALAADIAQKMGYKNVYSIMGGYRGMLEAEWPMRRS
jgi:rhodanese-related sulfurtransferase